MGLLHVLEKDVGHAKLGAQGPTGSGKTTSISLMAIGIYRYFKLKGPVAFYDSERGSGFVRDLFAYAKIPLVGVRSRTFKDLVSFMEETERDGIAVTIIDSITHPWRELMADYKRTKKLRLIRVQDWGPIKDAWHGGYSTRYVNAKQHILMCGRQANVFEDVEDEDNTGEKKGWKAIKVGTKMSTEGETGYEPNLLIEFEKRLLKDGGSYARVANVIKDRSFRLDGAECTFEMPMKNGLPDLARLVDENAPFAFIKPHVESLDPAAGLVSPGINLKPSEAFDDSGLGQGAREDQEKMLLLGNIEALLVKYWPGQEKLSKKAKGDLIEAATYAMNKRTRNWTVVETKFSLDDVKALFMYIDMLTQPSNRPMLDEALATGLGPDGKIENPDVAVDAVKNLCLKALNKGPDGESPLPF